MSDFVYGVDFPDLNIVSYYSLDNDNYTAPNVYDFFGNSSYDLVNTGATTNISGVINEQFGFYTGDYLLSANEFSEINNVDEFTLNIWVDNLNIGGGEDGIISFYHDVNNYFSVTLMPYLNNEIWVYHYSSTNCYVAFNYDYYQKLNMLTIVFNGSIAGIHKIYMYINGSYDNADYSAGTCAGNIFPQNEYLTIGAKNSGSYFFNGELDEVGFWDRALTQSEVTALYNSGSGLQPPSDTVVNEDIIVNINTPLNNTFLTNTTPTINYNFLSDSIDTANCSLYRNSTYVNSTITTNNINTDLSDSLLTDNTYLYYIECSNLTNSNVSRNYNYILDLTMPNIYGTFPLNDTHYNDYFNYSIINVSDRNLNNCSVSWNGTREFDFYNVSRTGEDYIFYFNYSYDDFVTYANPLGYEYFNFTCDDLTGNINSFIIIIYFDMDIPTITLNSPSDFDYLIYASDVYFDISYYDTYLWKTNTTITNLNNGSMAYNRYTENNSIDYQYDNFTFTFNVSDYGFGDFEFFAEAVDKHTIEKWDMTLDVTLIDLNDKNDKLNDKNDKLIYHLPEGNIEFTYPKGITVETIVSRDRWRQKFIYDDYSLDEVEVEVEADNLVYFADSPFNCHLALYGKYWYDCVGLTFNSFEYETDKRVKFKYFPNQTKGFDISDSIGGLNYVNKTLYFTIFNTSIPALSLNDSADCDLTYTVGSLGYFFQLTYCPDVYVPCNYTTDISLDIDNNVFFGLKENDYVYGKITTNNTDSNLSCISYAKTNDSKLIQTNPKYLSKETSLLDFRSQKDTRQFFEIREGVGQVHWSKDNLVIDGRTYIFGVECSTDCGNDYTETNVTVLYKYLNSPITRGFWVENSMTGIILLGFGFWLLVIAGFGIWRIRK